MTTGFESALADIRVILYHKQSTSARTLFLVHAGGSVIAPEPLPPLATVLDEEENAAETVLVAHPASLAQALCRHFGLPPDSIEVDPEFAATIEIPGRLLTACIARLKHMDPPRAEFAERGGRFAALTELRGAPPAEMELLRRAYRAILGG